MRRVVVALCSTAFAGYVTPLALALFDLKEPYMLALAAVLGGGAQTLLPACIEAVRQRVAGATPAKQTTKEAS